MTAEDLFAAIGGLESSRLARSELTDIESFKKPNKEEIQMTHGNTRKLIRNILIAAIIVTMLSVTAYAVVNARIRLKENKYQNHEIVTGTPTGAYDVEIGFEKTTNEYLELGAVYPQKMPEGYTISFVSDKSLGMQHIVYADKTGADVIRFIAQLGSDGGQIELRNVTDEKAVTIQGLPGTYYQFGNGGQAIFWQNEEQGIGFTLITEKANPDIDLKAIADSVAPGEPLTPTLASGYDTALRELGDYRITELPKGFVETEFMASPLENGGDWYAYVRRWYGDKITTNHTIYFEYEHFQLESDEPTNHPTEPVENVPETILQYNGGGEPVTIQDMPGAINEECITWVDWDAQVVFMIHASGRTSQEMLQLANSVQRFN